MNHFKNPIAKLTERRNAELYALQEENRVLREELVIQQSLNRISQSENRLMRSALEKVALATAPGNAEPREYIYNLAHDALDRLLPKQS